MDERQDEFSAAGLTSQMAAKGRIFDNEEAAPTPELKVVDGEGSAQLLPTSAESPVATISDIAKAMPSKRSNSEAEDSIEPLTKLPRIGFGLLYALTFSLLIAATTYSVPILVAHGMPRTFWLAMPVVIYFAYCMLRMSDIAALKFNSAAPLSSRTVTLISLISLTFFPVFGQTYHFPNRMLDPFFIVWMLAQIAWPLLISQSIEKTLKLRTLVLGVVAALPIFAVSTLPVLFHEYYFFVPLWLMSQFACVVYLSTRLRQLFIDDLKVNVAKLALQRAKVSGVSKDDIVVRYRPYAAVERWIKQRFTGGELVKGMQLLLLWISVPVVVVGLLVGLTMLDNLLGTNVAETAHLPKAAAQAAAAMNNGFLGFFVGLVFLLISVPAMLYLKTPTHLLFNRSGLKFLWRHGSLSSDGQELKWENLEAIELERPRGSTKALDQFLCFKPKLGHVHKMKLSAFDTIEDREKILAMIRHWAPNVPRPPEVEQCLEPPANHSYTEMWLQALAAPPKRERLKPLVDGGSVQAGKYRIINQLGVGGQGAAYLANDNINEQVVVLKEFILPVHVDVNVRKSALESFENEARILKQLDSPNVVQLIDFFVEDHRAYLVLEHIDGMSLRELVEKSGAMKESQVKELALQMCSILSYLHSLSPPVVHRDFTPDNLILQRDGTLKLIDFNVAQQVEATVTGTVVGKHAYLPPEQFRGMPTSQSDIYACGATLHFLLTGADPEPISQSHPGKAVADLSAGMDHIVAHATQLDTVQRYERIDQMADELRTMS